jgi:uncharacterized protein
LRPFRPLIPNPDFLTVAGSFWPRPFDARRFPVESVRFQPTPAIPIIVDVQRSAREPGAANLILIHGLEGSSEAGYMRSMAHAALVAGFNVHRFNLRNCGGTELEIPQLYNGGLTEDLLSYVQHLHAAEGAPVFLIGFSLGGNVVLKLAGELAAEGPRYLAGLCAASTPLDLGASARQIGARRNRLYELRFLKSMVRRIRAKNEVFPGRYPIDELPGLRTLYDFDDRVTAPLAGFRDAEHYYSTQSSIRFLPSVRVPTMLIQAQDDPMIPYAVYQSAAVTANPNIELHTTTHGGHLGFLARDKPRLWLDDVVVAWIVKTRQGMQKEPVE